eukprot:148353-Chlamydomonas_euryale.AAC.2
MPLSLGAGGVRAPDGCGRRARAAAVALQHLGRPALHALAPLARRPWRAPHDQREACDAGAQAVDAAALAGAARAAQLPQ